MFQFEIESTIEPLNAGLFVSPGYGTHDTRVLDTYELLFVTSGQLDLFEDEEHFHVEKNQTLILCPGHRHGGLGPYPADLNFYWVHFRVHNTDSMHAPVMVPKITTVADPEFLIELFCQFISDQEAVVPRDLGFAQLVTLMLCEISDDIGGKPAAKRVRGSTTRQRAIAEQVQSHINDRYREMISTSMIAQQLHYSTDYVERTFRHVYHRSIVDALHEKRVNVARALLRVEGRKNISEIAFSCGFRDPRYFRRVFKRVTGLTPKQFRSLYNRMHINTH